MTSSRGETARSAGPPWLAVTGHGYRLDEVISALQKTIRRGDSDAACFWAYELAVSGYGAYCWRRLFIIACEDIGLADPQAAVVVNALHAMSVTLMTNAKKAKNVGPTPAWPTLQILEAVWYLARAPKNRELADLECTLILRMKRRQLLEIPDVALDQHTSRGRAMRRDLSHFMNDDRAIENAVEVDGDRWRARFLAEWNGESLK